MGKYQTAPGSPLPIGATRTPNGINFALFSRHAQTAHLVLSSSGQDKKTDRIPLTASLNKTGDIWHILLINPPAGLRYGYTLSGPHNPRKNGHFYDEQIILLDPYAKELHSPRWGADRSCLGTTACCIVPEIAYNWEGDRPLNTPLRDTIIYEMHVRGFTNHPSAGVTHPGTFKGLTEKINYLKELGITAVELMPVTEFNENEPLFVDPASGERLKNFWGYSPLSFFAPKSGYSSNSDQPLTEFRDMVKMLHQAGIEVILDIVFNHTAEGGVDGPTTSFRGIDNTIYYLLDPWTKTYLNFSGCGNTCNCNHPIVRNLIMDALHWWVIHMHVDGFRFDLASILGRDQNGEVLPNPPVVEMIAEDPVLADTKIIAEAWDAAGLYQVGSFSAHHRWAEWNGRFRDDVRRFMRGDPGLVPALATRIAGSSDLYQHNGRRPCNSINFITSHDGFTLTDLVSYEKKHNLNNGENNRDGEKNNLSWNSGVEGKTGDRDILTLRARRIRSMAVLLFLSQGVPMLTAGDEFGRSQRGNNNAWCQDNTLSWLDWDLAQSNTMQLRFFKKLIWLRRQHPAFRREDFFLAETEGAEPPHIREISWQGLRPGEQDWSQDCQTLAFLLNGSKLPEGQDDDFFVLINGHRNRNMDFVIPPPPQRKEKRIWRKIIDTERPSPHDFSDINNSDPVQSGSNLTISAMGCAVLQSTGNIMKILR